MAKNKFPIPAVILVIVTLLMATQTTYAQNPTAGSDTLSQAEIDRIVIAFTLNETEFRKALYQYAFKRDALIQTLGMGGQVTGEYHRVSNFTFDDQGNRYEKISFFPMPSIGGISQQDLDELGGVAEFALQPSTIARYNVKYIGKEKIDELHLYVFDVTPKVVPDAKKVKERLFTGRVWVEDQDLQIVKTKAKGIPETKDNKYPFVETYREQIGGRYWFPAYSYTDEELIFDSGEAIRVRMKVSYTDYTLSHAKVKVVEVDGVQTPKPEAKPSPPKPKP
jgi:hypothetical protein